MGSPAKETTGTTSDGEVLVAKSGGINEIEVPARYIVALSYSLAMGTTGLDDKQQPIHDCGSHEGSIVLHLMTNDQIAWGLLSGIGVGAEIVFSFHNESEKNPPEYRTVVTKPRFKLQADGVIATYEFHSVSIFDARLNKDRPTLSTPTEAYRLVEASRTWKLVNSAELTSRQTPLSPQEIRTGVSAASGLPLVRQDRLFPHEVFEAVAAACGWKTSGTFEGFSNLPTVQKSPYTINDITEWSRNMPIDRWVTEHLIPICRTGDNDYYTLTFSPDDTGETVARFHAKNFDITRQSVVKPDDDSFPVISYGSSVSNSEVIECDVDVDALSTALMAAGIFVGSGSDAGTTEVDDSVRKSGYLDDRGSRSGGLSVPGFDSLVRPLPGRTFDQFYAGVAQATAKEATGIKVRLVVPGTNKYRPGAFVRFTYSLPNGDDFLGISNLVYQVLGVLYQVGQQGFTTSLEMISIIIPAKSPSSDATSPPTDVPQAAQTTVPVAFTEQTARNGFATSLLANSGTRSGAIEEATRFFQGKPMVKSVDVQGRRLLTPVPGTAPVTNIQIQPSPSIDTFNENPAE
jgi:hypothetical protein